MRRRLLSIALALLATQFGAIATVRAQLVLDHDGDASVRGFHGAKPSGGVKRSFQSDSEARAELDRILKAVGLNFIGDRIALRASAETGNAEAGITKKGDRYIFYNATFMQKLKERTTEQWSLVSVLAHELGHHVAFHTELSGNDHKYELEADYFSGFVLRRLGASLDQSHAAMRAISPKEATATHPGLDQRMQVITIGWTDGGGQGAPRGLKERAPDQPSPPVAIAPPPIPPVTKKPPDPLKPRATDAEPKAGTLAHGECIVLRVHYAVCASGLREVCGAPDRQTERKRRCLPAQ